MKRYLISLFLAFWSSQACLQPLESATVENIVERLESPKAKTRNLRNLSIAPRSIDLVIQFDFDSARLQDSSHLLLNNLASAMRSEKLDGMNFTVEGHTDSKGTPEYNQRLSSKRADSVVNYLIQRGVSATRLSGLGKGASALLYSDRPEASENRRVRITTTP